MGSKVEKLLTELEQMGIFDVDFPEQLVGGVVFAVKSDKRSMHIRRLVGGVTYPELATSPLFTYNLRNREQVYHTSGLEEVVLIEALQRFRDNMIVLITRSLKCHLRLPTGHPENYPFVRSKDEYHLCCEPGQGVVEPQPPTVGAESPDAKLVETFNKLIESGVFNPTNRDLFVGQFYVRIFVGDQKLGVYHESRHGCLLLASITPALQVYSDASKFGMEELDLVLKHLLEILAAKVLEKPYKELLNELDCLEGNKIVDNRYIPEANEPSPFGPPVKLLVDNPWVVWRRIAYPNHPTDGHAARDALIQVLVNEPGRSILDLENVPYNEKTDADQLSLGWVIHMVYTLRRSWEVVHRRYQSPGLFN